MNITPRFFYQILACLWLCACLPSVAAAQSQLSAGDQARFTAGVLVYVWHPDDRPAARGWNDGWFNNEGIFADLTWPVWALGPATKFRAGITGGVFENSIYRSSVFFGGVAEIETHATPRLAFNIGAYAGGITGYANEFGPALAPYAGMSYALTERFELGLRGFWFPAKTIAGSDLAPSDAYISTVTIGTRF